MPADTKASVQDVSRMACWRRCSGAELGWAATYVAVGERQPLIWLVPAAGALLAAAVLVRLRLGGASAASPSRE